MSINFYFHPEPNVCKECGHDKADDNRHIGMSAAGWVFLWRCWESPALRSPREWVQYLENTPGEIRNEYGAIVPLGDFLIGVMLSQSNPNRHSRHAGSDAIAYSEVFDISYREFS